MIRTIFTGWRVVAMAFILVSAFATTAGDHQAAAAGTTISPEALEAACRSRGGSYNEIWQDGLLVHYECILPDGDVVVCDYGGKCESTELSYPAPDTAPITTAPADATDAGTDVVRAYEVLESPASSAAP